MQFSLHNAVQVRYQRPVPARNLLAAILAAIVIAIGSGDLQTAAEPPLAAAQALIHAPTGFQFPAKVGPFRRENEMQRYDPEGRHVSVGYNAAPHSPEFIAMTVYVYPAPEPAAGVSTETLLDEEFHKVEREVIAKDRFARLLYEQTVTVDQALLPSPARRAVFATHPASWGPSFSEALLFRAGTWFVLYRASYRQSCVQACSDRTREFVLALKWPDSLLKGTAP